MTERRRSRLPRQAGIAILYPTAANTPGELPPMEWVTTTIMLNRLSEAQDAAWDEFVAHFQGPVRRFVQRMGLSEATAEDVVQETMVAFLRGFREGRYSRDRGRLSSWLFGIAYREALRAARNSARDRQSPERHGRTTFFTDQPDEQARATWDDSWERFVLVRCLEKLRGELSDQNYRAFELTSLRAVPAGAVAEQLGMTRNAVFIARHRALRRVAELRAEFEGTA